MDRYDEMRMLLNFPYALRADGTVLCAVKGEDPEWTGVKKLCGGLALRWDGRVLCRGWGERVNYISKWRNVVDIACCGTIELCLTRLGDLTWVRSRNFQIAQGYCAAGWTDVERVFVTCDPYSDEMSYADYAVGLCRDGRARVEYLGGSDNRSREIEDLLNRIGGIKKLGRNCTVLAADGRIYDFGTKGMGKVSKGLFADFDLPTGSGVAAEEGCILMEDGTVKVPEGCYAGAESWRDIVCISHGFVPITTGCHGLMGLRKDGRVFLAERYGQQLADVSEWKLFNSLDSFPDEREAAKGYWVAEGLALDREEQAKARQLRLKRLMDDRDSCVLALERLKQELAQARGPFAGGRRKKMEQEIAEYSQQLRELEEQIINAE